MADPVTIAVELAFDKAFTLIKEAIVTIYTFKSLLLKLEATFQQIEPTIKDMDELNKVLDRSGRELKKILELIKKGETLVEKCSKIRRFDIYKKLVYSRKLNDWDEDIKSFFGINLPAITALDVKRTLVKVEQIETKVGMLLRGQGSSEGLVNSGGGGGGGGGGGYYRKYAEPDAPTFAVGMEEQYKEVKSRLLQDGSSVVVVSGPGGCGKTTLVELIYHDPEIKGEFEKNAFYFKVSESFDAVQIIREMLHIKGSDASNIQTEDDAFRELKKLLHEVGQNPILLVLDDVWSKLTPLGLETSESELLLEKFAMDNIQKYKILVTSRFEFQRFGRPVRLGSLKHEDAVKVFLHAATPPGGRNGLPNEDLINEIVKRCKGSPLALTVIGRSLCGRQTSIWQSRLHSLSEDSISILDWDSEIINCLSKSLDDLSSRSAIKDCFFDLASFPEDHQIPTCTLIDIWTELYNLSAEVHAMALLRELSNRSLVNLAINGNDGDGDGWYGEHYAMQHDLLRQLTIRHSSQDPISERRRLMLHLRGNAFPKWWTEQTEHPMNARILSISTDEKFSSKWPPHVEVPAVEIAIFNFRAEKYTLPELIGKMTLLKALIVANNSFLPAELTNFSLLSSLSCLKKIRLERIRIPFLTMTNNLHNLEKVTLFMCEFSEDILAADNWSRVAMPKLLEVSVEYCKNLVKLPDGLGDVTSLRKLNITNCPDLCELPGGIGRLLNLEILRLNACTNLSELPDSTCKLQNLRFLDISECIGIDDLPYKIGELQNLTEFHMKGRLNLSKLPSSIINLRHLKRVTCHEVQARLWKPLEQFLTNLKVEVIEEKHSLDWLLRSEFLLGGAIM